MKILLQSYRNGTLEVADVPAPGPRRGRLLVRNAASLVSAGTERYLLDLARKSLIGKALARPDLVAQVVRKARTEGVQEAWQQATQRLDVPIPLGYSCAGMVIDVGEGVTGFAVGDRVACAGSGFASHAEYVSVPAQLCARVPEGVDLESAAFVAVGGVALEAVRVANVELGSRVAVIGLGLIGQIAVQLLRAAGCHVLGVDISERRAALAREYGAAQTVVGGQLDVLNAARVFTDGQGVDAAIILAAAKSNEPLQTAAEITRERGRVVAAGLVGLEIPRKPFFDKELEFVVSRAWGPGLFDPDYAERGRDYPYAYARWTAGRNAQEFLLQAAAGGVRVSHLITHRYAIGEAPAAYDLITGGTQPYLGVVLTYPPRAGDALEAPEQRVTLPAARAPGERRPARAAGQPAAGADRPVGLGLVGAGLFARTTLMPALTREGVRLRGVVTASGHTAFHAARKYGFEYAASDLAQLLDDPVVDGVIITTRHDLHASLAAQALRAGKAVFVEKPLAVDQEGLDALVDAWRAVRAETGAEPRLMVGFNRRYSPLTVRLRERLDQIAEPLAVACRVNAGPVPSESWVHDRREGGGRVIGEVCHFVDVIQFLTGALPVRVYATSLNVPGYGADENVVVTLHMENGSVGTISYVASGDKSFARERVEVLGGGGVGVLDNFRSVEFVRGGQRMNDRRWRLEKGYAQELDAFLRMVRGGSVPVPFAEHVATTLATFAIEESMAAGAPVAVRLPSDLEQQR